VSHEVRSGRGAWFQLIKGTVEANGTKLNPGDALSTDDAGVLSLSATAGAEGLLFDLK
jgi:redox-sensitive bicupin YhaK (pirin superfamily)